MKNYLTFLSFAILITMAISSNAQVVITDDGSPESIQSSAVFELQSTSKGFLVPKMTTAQRNAISSPAAGLLVYDTTLKRFFVHDGSEWRSTGSSWLGSTTRIKLLPKDFVGTLGGGKGDKTASAIYDDDSGNDSYALTTTENSSYLAAFIAIPSGYKATAVTIYGSSTEDSFYVYKGDITSTDNLEISGNSDHLGAEEISASGGTVTFSSPVSSTTTNYLIIAVSFNTKNTDLLYGGYVAITPD